MSPASRFLACCAALVASSASADGVVRKFERVPACSDPRLRAAALHGDPVITTGLNTLSLDWHEDVRVQMPAGVFSFSRRFVSDLDALGQTEPTWVDPQGQIQPAYDPCAFSVLTGLRPQFGIGTQNYTHTLQTLVDTRCSRSTRVLTPDGDVRFFGPLPSVSTGASAWVPRLRGEGAGEPSRLKVTKGLLGFLVFEWFSESGQSFVYRLQGGLVYRLVTARNAEGSVVYTVQYQNQCGQFEPSSVSLADSTQTIQFRYTSAAPGPVNCPLSSISMGARTFVTYSLATNAVGEQVPVASFPESLTPGGWQDQIGLVSKRESLVVNGVALHPPDEGFQCPSCLPVGASVSTEVRHVHESALETSGTNIRASSEGWGAALSSSFQPLVPQLIAPPPQSQCVTYSEGTSVTPTQGRSTSTIVAGGRVETRRLYSWGGMEAGPDPFFTAVGIGATYSPMPLRVEKVCDGVDPSRCQSSSIDFFYGRPTADGLSVDLSCGSTPDAPTALVAVSDEARSFSVSPKAFSSAVGGNFEDRASYEGATNALGASPLSTTWRTFAYPRDRQKLVTEEEPSALMAGQRAITSRHYDAEGRLRSVVRTGYTPDGVGGFVQVHQATFFHHGDRCSGWSEQPLAPNRVSSVEGPCGVSDVNATHCELTAGRRSDLYYYDTRAAPPPTVAAFPQAATDFFNDGRLALVRTYTDVCGGAFLDTKYGSYTAEGSPEKVITPDDVVEESASTGMLTTRVSGKDPSKQTDLVLAWDRGNLQKVTYPNVIPGGPATQRATTPEFRRWSRSCSSQTVPRSLRRATQRPLPIRVRAGTEGEEGPAGPWASEATEDTAGRAMATEASETVLALAIKSWVVPLTRWGNRYGLVDSRLTAGRGSTSAFSILPTGRWLEWSSSTIPS